jgi:aminoglycoside phosphotransferase family enzyme
MRGVPLSFLQSPEAWGQLGLGGGPVETVQTRRSWIFLTQDHVLKLKKPVKESLIDFSTPALREQACRAELQINHRLAPGVYLAVVALRRAPSGWVLQRCAAQQPGPPSPPLGAATAAAPEPGPAEHDAPASDWLVLMRRLPADRMLDRLLAVGAAGHSQADALAERLAAFWRSAPRTSEPARSLLERAEEELQSSVALIGQARWGLPDVGPVLERCARVLRAGRSTIAHRIDHGRIVEGHGDLRPEHVCLPRRPPRQTAPSGPTLDAPADAPSPAHALVPRDGAVTSWPERPLVIDALEFHPALRAVDPFDELAYLALECRQLGAPAFGLRVMARCEHLLDDAPAHGLLRLYTAQRALLRARLALSHLLEPTVRDPGRWQPLAAWYLRSADAALQPLQTATRSGRHQPGAGRWRSACPG